MFIPDIRWVRRVKELLKAFLKYLREKLSEPSLSDSSEETDRKNIELALKVVKETLERLIEEATQHELYVMAVQKGLSPQERSNLLQNQPPIRTTPSFQRSELAREHNFRLREMDAAIRVFLEEETGEAVSGTPLFQIKDWIETQSAERAAKRYDAFKNPSNRDHFPQKSEVTP